MDKKNKKGLIAIALVLGVGYFLFKKFKKSSAYTPTNNEIDENLGGTSGVNPTLSQEKMKELADKMFIAFDGYGTDMNGQNGLINLFPAIKNNDDLMGVVAAYGIKEVSSGKWNIFSNFIGNLPETIGNELTQSQISNINSILVKNGVNIRFNQDGTLTSI